MVHVSPEVALAISRQKARYGRYADTKEWDKFERAIALPDARYAYLDMGGQPLVAGNQALVFDSAKACAVLLNKLFAPLHTLHSFGPGDFEQVGPDEVKAVFAMEDQLMSKYLGSWAELRGGGFYYETWKRVDGQWYIQELRLERSYMKMNFLFMVGRLGKTLGVPCYYM